jgi:glycine cleavage system regulatory protein
MQKTSLVLTCIGADREGLVEALSEVVRKFEGNWQESRMARLGGRFAGILQIEVPTREEEALRAALDRLDASGLRVVVETTAQHQPLEYPLELELIGLDRAGIIFEISRVLRTHGVNVEELDTTRQNAPGSGELLFQARASLRIPAGLDQAQLFSELEAIAADLMVDVLVEPPMNKQQG